MTERMVGHTVAEFENSGTGGFLVLSIPRIGGSTVQNPRPDLILAEEDRFCF